MFWDGLVWGFLGAVGYWLFFCFGVELDFFVFF